MSGQDDGYSFILEDLRVLSVRGDANADSSDPAIMWDATYYDASDETGRDPKTRVLIATLHVHAPLGWANVIVGGLITPVSNNSVELSEEATTREIADSIALETLYDFARIQMKSVVGTVNVDVDLPYKSPDPTVRYSDGTDADAED